MAAFPITGRFIGDFVPHLVAVDTDDMQFFDTDTGLAIWE